MTPLDIVGEEYKGRDNIRDKDNLNVICLVGETRHNELCVVVHYTHQDTSPIYTEHLMHIGMSIRMEAGLSECANAIIKEITSRGFLNAH